MKRIQAPYILAEGKDANERLEFQHRLLRGNMRVAFEMASSFKDLNDATVLDFGCGTSRAYEDIRILIGSSGGYIGVDSSKEQISFNQSNFSDAKYIVGDERSPSVIRELGSVDIIYLRSVVMHQKRPQEFLQALYKAAKSKAIFIIQEPESTPEYKAEMIKRYPFVGELCDLKLKVGQRVGLEYNFAKYIEPVLRELNPRTLVHKTDPLEIPLCEAKKLFSQSVNEMNKKDNTLLTPQEVAHYLTIISNLPEDESSFWVSELLHTFIVQKA